MKKNKNSKKAANVNDSLSVILHGEAMIIGGVSIPAGAVQKKEKFPYIVADSETTGNHHILALEKEEDAEYFTFFEFEGKTFMQSERDCNVKCVHDNRHDTVKLPAGTYEFGIQNEYDPFKARLEKVRD